MSEGESEPTTTTTTTTVTEPDDKGAELPEVREDKVPEDEGGAGDADATEGDEG